MRSVITILLLAVASIPLPAAEFAEAQIYIEYNFSANDLGFHVRLDGEDWRSLRILNPESEVVYEVSGRGGFEDLGMTELFFEGAEPSLSEMDLQDLLDLFPEGEYRFEGVSAGGEPITGTAELTYDVPDAPVVFTNVDDDSVTIRWRRVSRPAAILPEGEIEIEGYQVIVDSFSVTLPPSATRVTLPREFVKTLEPGVIAFEVLAIDASGNQTITESSFLRRGDD
jgi:hypothetical protein